MRLIYCLLYAAAIGLGSFLLGRLLPGSLFEWDRFPYAPWTWEAEGKVYDRLFKIRKWQAKVPDMSKIFPKLMPAKKVTGQFPRELPSMVRETCIAEFIHVLLCLLILPCLWIWPSWGGVLFTVCYILCNVPFILIQRYNRPRLLRLLSRMKEKSTGKEI